MLDATRWRSLAVFPHENLQFIPNKDEMRKTNPAAARKKNLSISPAINCGTTESEKADTK